MENQQIGKVVDCKHCNGTGKCNCSSCIADKRFNIHDHRREGNEPVACTSCRGAGSVWIGPESITIINNIPR